MLAGYSQSWRITTAFAAWWGALVEGLGFRPGEWPFFQAENIAPEIGVWAYAYFGTWMVGGMVLGSFLSSTLAGQWRWRPMANRSMAGLAVVGGLLMGFGARLASGCNVGALASGIPSFSLHSYLFFIALLGGAALGAYLLRKLFV